MSKLTDKHAAALRKAFEQAVSDLRNSVKLADLVEAISAGDADRAFRVLGLSRAAFASVEDELLNAYQAGGLLAEAQIGIIPVAAVGSVAFRFDTRDAAAQRWLLESSSKLVTEILDDQRELIRSVLAKGMQAGANPRSTALNLVGRVDPVARTRVGGMVGLTSQQEGWIASARAELEALDSRYFTRALRDKRFDSSLRKAFAEGKVPDTGVVDRAITQMQNRALKYRADTIARTESLNALRAGQFQAIDQAVKIGEVDKQHATKVWDATMDGKTREDHAAMDGQIVAISDPFLSPEGSALMFPGDGSMGASGAMVINCRCATSYKIDFIGKAVKLEGIV